MEVCVELETPGPPTPLKPKESLTYEESWEVRAEEHFLTLETVHRISEQLST
jgi:hypothetical protein